MSFHTYMFGNQDGNSQRRRREEHQVELRRQRTEELLKKKRSSSQQPEGVSSFAEYAAPLSSDSLEQVYNAAFECRTKLSVECNPPIADLIYSGLVPRFVELLQLDTYRPFLEQAQADGTLQAASQLVTKTRVEAAWVLTNVASGSTEQTSCVIDAGATPYLVSMLAEEDECIIDQSVWALGNIAGDNESMRDMVISLGAHPHVVQLIERFRKSQAHIKILRNLVWLLSNLTRGRNPPPPQECLASAYACVEELIKMDDPEVVADCAWCLSYIADVSPELAERLVGSSIMARCYAVLHAFVSALRARQPFLRGEEGAAADPTLARIGAHAVCPIVRMLGNITTGSDKATDAVAFGGFLGLFRDIFYLYENKKLPRIRKELCWLLSNIAAGTDAQRKLLIDSDLLNLLIDALSRYELYIRREALFAVTNLLYYVAKSNAGYIDLEKFMKAQLIEALQSYLAVASNTPALQAHTLDALRYALEAGARLQQETGDNPVVAAMVDSRLVDDIEELQVSGNTPVVQKAYNIIMDFFDGEDE